MRPERLDIQGFAPFREPTRVDFADLDLFALTGPTGAGKSSLIDAMVFALYGSVPRHGKKAVAPVISLGKAAAAVRLDFQVDGISYTVARKVQRNTRGGVGSEARLERQGDVLASGGEVTSAVEALLGLELDHFTRSVVLPQGEFAAFLHDTPAGQQDLVKALLDMGTLDTVRQLAGERSRTAAALADQARVAWERLADATPESVGAFEARVEALDKLAETVEGAEQAILEGKATAEELSAHVQRLEGQLGQLNEVSMPPGVAELAGQVSERRQQLAWAREQVTEAEAALAEAMRADSELPARAELESAREASQRLAAAKERRQSVDVDGLEASARAAAETLEQAVAMRDQARQVLERLRDQHAAHALGAGLGAGDPCPVCARPLEERPDVPAVDLAAEETRLQAAEAAVEEAQSRCRNADTALAEGRAVRAAAEEAVAELEQRLSSLPHPPDLDETLARRRQLDERVASCRDLVENRRTAMTEAEAALQALEGAAGRAWSDFGQVRDRLAGLEPPPPPRDDLARAWGELSEWARSRAEQLEETLSEARASAESAEAAVEKQREELEGLLIEAGVEGSGTASARLAAALATVRTDLRRAQERLEERNALAADSERFSTEATVATALSNHLKANRFEGWLLAEALATLVEGANDLLADLTAGAYSLALSERAIEVVDHRNADELRSVRSLSGGETFLVSLALALSLGEQLATVADRGGARLEAIFLDEGFGSLDAETMETVTVVVSELAAQGRMVGVVTHVKELADQMPVRFEVRPGPDGSTIERVGGVV